MKKVIKRKLRIKNEIKAKKKQRIGKRKNTKGLNCFFCKNKYRLIINILNKI